MQYNYVFFDSDAEYYRIARYDIEKLENVRIRVRELPLGGRVQNFLFKVHTSERLNRLFYLPFQSLWNQAFLGDLNFPGNMPICFIFTVAIGNFPYQGNLFEYLRKKYPGCKLVLLLRDVIAVAKRLVRNFDPEKAKKLFDEIYTINTLDAQKYGFKTIHSFCSQYPVEVDADDKKSDVIFIGVVKDRLDTVRRAYEKFTAAGLTCDFLLVSKDEIEGLPEGLIVQKNWIPYSEMLKRTVNSKCILEITQKGTDALTSRCLEALCYNKKLISDNFRLKDTKYYDPRYMCLFENIDDVIPSFISDDVEVDYNYDGAFSPIKGLELIERDLLGLEKKG